MNPMLHDAGETIYGPRWHAPLAHDLGVSARTVQRWAAGRTSVPTGVYADILRLAQERIDDLVALTEWLREVG
jgi:hypothetical protein